MTALSRQSVSRVMHELVTAGAVALGFRRVTVVAPDRLEQIANAAV
jgi:hypothetical protein